MGSPGVISEEGGVGATILTPICPKFTEPHPLLFVLLGEDMSSPCSAIGNRFDISSKMRTLGRAKDCISHPTRHFQAWVSMGLI